MRPYMKHLNCYGDSNDDRPAQVPDAWDDISPTAVAREEHAALTALIDVLKREREAILSLSLKDITGTNGEKERIVKTLATLRRRREACLGCIARSREEMRSGEYLALAGMIRLSMEEAKTYLRKNKVLLSLSAGRVRSVMEFVARTLKSRSTTYGRELKRGPVLFAGRV